MPGRSRRICGLPPRRIPTVRCGPRTQILQAPPDIRADAAFDCGALRMTDERMMAKVGPLRASPGGCGRRRLQDDSGKDEGECGTDPVSPPAVILRERPRATPIRTEAWTL